MSSLPVVLWQCPPKTVLVAVDFGDASARAQDGSDAESVARTCAERLATIAGGSLIEGGPVTQCKASVMERASLVVMATRTIVRRGASRIRWPTSSAPASGPCCSFRHTEQDL